MTPDAGTLRPGEVTTDLPPASDAQIAFIGRLRTPWTDRAGCPKRGDAMNGPLCRVELAPRWQAALRGVDAFERLELLYWMHLARRDLVLQNPQGKGMLFGTFALRSPMRPNPLSSSVVSLVGVEPDGLIVRGLDCVDGTPLVDIKPLRCPLWPDEPHGRT